MGVLLDIAMGQVVFFPVEVARFVEPHIPRCDRLAFD